MTLNVHLYYPPEPAHLADFTRLLDPGVRLTSGRAVPEEADFDVLVTGRVDAAWLTASPRLRRLIIPWAGVPESVSALLPGYPHIAVHNLHYNAEPVAEFALALLLAAAKAIVPADRALRANDWRPRYAPSDALLLRGRTALIVGYGAIGRHLARLCRAVGMAVVATRRTAAATGDDGVARIVAAEALAAWLPQADVLLLTVPLTPATDGLIGSAELALLPSHAILVNVARGRVVDQAALYDALRARRLHAAALDVWYNYPPDEPARADTAPADFPFGELDNVVLSPHRSAGLHGDADERLRLQALATLLNAAARSEPVPNRVDLAAGY